jgi:hypothetical protein
MTNKTLAFLVTAISAMGSGNFGCGDSGGNTSPTENSRDACRDNADNDGDGATDCGDLECKAFCGDTEDAGDTEFQPDTEDSWHNKPNRGEVVDPGVYVAKEPDDGSFALVADGAAAPLVVSSDDYDGVVRVVDDLKADIESVTTVAPTVVNDVAPSESAVVIIGTIGKSPLIDDLVKTEKLDVTDIVGKWETFITTTVDSPMDGVDKALVIAGSDQRGTIYGAYDLSSQIGVSPWHFWSDVPPSKKESLYVLSGRHSQGEPAVKYRGIFINDENPSLGRWNKNYFPDEASGEGSVFKKEFYAKVFEVILRLKANYLWPAVWGRAFAEDDPENHAEASRYGIVMGTSHEAPMMRGIEEWNRGVTNDADGNPISDAYGGNGEWSYLTNKEAVTAYWKDGIERMVEEGFEGVVTIGMRGPGDIGLPPEEGIALANDFIKAQRDIIADVTGLNPAQVPQNWTMYSEVQGWWVDEGLRAPSDVTIIWSDDNFGNMRMVPDKNEPERTGGYGLYYHFDYVGGPRCYKWADTSLLPNVWEQLNLAYTMGTDRLWVANVGDLKGNELPTQYFLDYAWNPERWPLDRISDWEQSFTAQQFGKDNAEAVAKVLHTYSLLQSDRKPELLNRKGTSTGCPFSITNYREMEQVVEQWLDLAKDAEDLGNKIGDEYQDAYYELVLYQVKASALMYELRLAGCKNDLYEEQGRASTNDMAAVAEDRFEKSRAMADYYNNELAGGKWNGFQTQPYLGYSTWQEPEEDNEALEDFIYPALLTMEVPTGADMGVAVEGTEDYWPESENTAVLPTFSPYQTQPPQYIEVFNRGADPFDYEITLSSDVPWLSITPSEGTIDGTTKEVRAELTISDWSAVPKGSTTATITVTNLDDSTSVDITANVDNPIESPADDVFVESNGYVSMEAEHYSRAVDAGLITWQLISDIGRTGGGMTPFPVTADRVTPGGDSAGLEYDMNLFTTGEVTVYAYLSPRQNVFPTDGLTFALSMDDGDIKSLNITKLLNSSAYPLFSQGWEKGVADNVHVVSTKFDIQEPGVHTLKFWAQDPTVILQKLVVNTGGMQPSYLGPKESYFGGIR